MARTDQLHHRLVALVEEAQDIDVRRHEAGTAEAAMEHLLPRVQKVLVDSLELAQTVLATYEPEEEEDPLASLDAAFSPTDEPHEASNAFYKGIDELVEDGSAERVSDIAFLAITELRQKQHALSRLRPTLDGWEIVAECGSALRRIAKSFTALELVLCDAEGLTKKLAFASELATSLEIRRQYSLLRRAIQGPEPTEATIRTRLRAVGTRIAMLVGRGIYTDLRVHDRMQLRKLQHRILDWLRDGGDGDDSWVEGRRLWQDLDGFAGLLQHVNRRQELVEHDAQRVSELLAVFRRNDEGAFLDALAEHGRALEGLHDELDAQLTKRTPDPSAVGAVLRQLARGLGAEVAEVPGTSSDNALRWPAW